MTDLERRLMAVSEVVDWPRGEVTERVRARIAVPRRRPQVWLRVAVVALIVVVTFAVATPWGRQAVANLLGVTGITIRWGETTAEIGDELDLGEMVNLQEAMGRVGFPLLVPDDPPATIYHDVMPSGGAIHMVWAADEPLPAGDGDIGVLYSQFQVSGSDGYFKTVDDSTVETMTVRGLAGFWIEGAEHYLAYWDEEPPIEESTRLAGNVLAWHENGVTHRIETRGDLDSALALAESLSTP
ncbi:MAG: hypothetical protein L0Z49_00280 [Actinobacteria bacterium]|nr:hypothetical protein [Actinomycetota bacterium]